MTIIIKFYIILIINLLAVFWLVRSLVRNGHSFSEALNVCWNRIMLNHRAVFGEHDTPVNRYSLILNKTWWFLIFSAVILWIIDDSPETLLFLGLLVLIHLFWYLRRSTGGDHEYNRIINLNSTWGIVFQEIDENSILKDRSLAELDLRKKNLLVLAIERGDQTVSFPKGVETLAVGDRLVIFGDLNYYRGMLE